MDIKEFSKAVGLSISTVSRALNGYTDVSEATRARVEREAARLGYVPNYASRKLRRKSKLETVGFVAPRHDRNFLNPVLLETLSGLDTELSKRGLNLSVLSLHDDEDENVAIRNLVRNAPVDALVLSRTRRHDARIELLKQLDFPFVTFGKSELSLPYRYVEIDHASAAEKSVKYLCEMGHTKIALLNGPEQFMLHWRRRTGFLAEMKRNGLPIRDDWIHAVNLEPIPRAAIDRLLQSPTRPTAVICASDSIALGLYSSAADLGLSIGEDISVIGTDDLPASAHLSPGLTTVTSDRMGAGRALAVMLLDRADDETASQSFEMELVLRGSVAALT